MTRDPAPQRQLVIGLVRGQPQLASVTAALATLGIGQGDLSLIGRSIATEPAIGAPARPGDAVAYLADIGEVALPGLGPLIASGPLFATMAGMVEDDPRPAFTGLGHRLMACGVPEAQARRDEDLVRGGSTLVAAHVRTADLARRALTAMTAHGASDAVICRDDGLESDEG